jgi:hypothetical protein
MMGIALSCGPFPHEMAFFSFWLGCWLQSIVPLAEVTHDRTNEGKISSLDLLGRGNALWGHEGWT